MGMIRNLDIKRVNGKHRMTRNQEARIFSQKANGVHSSFGLKQFCTSRSSARKPDSQERMLLGHYETFSRSNSSKLIEFVDKNW